jgi:ribosomal protein S18 acetylase RimI-like enzyme
MYRLVVDVAYRRTGIGLALVHEGEHRLTELGCRRITALVVAKDAPSRRFWSRAGYGFDERVIRFVKSTTP